jgi:signal transduction histidine kinase
MGCLINWLNSQATPFRLRWLGLLMSVVIALMFYIATARTIERDASLRFANHAHNAQLTISSRIKSYTDVLRGAASFMQTSDKISREQFRAYVDGLMLDEHFPALQSINFAEYVPGEEAAEFVQRVRREQADHPFADHAFTIAPVGKRADYVVLTLIEDDEIKATAFGFDLLSVPLAAQAIISSRDTGVMVASGLIVAAISTPGKIGLAMRLPVYKPNMPRRSVAERRAAYNGSIGIAFSVPKLVDGVLNEIPVKNVRMLLTDEVPGIAHAVRAVGPPRVLFDSLDNGAGSAPSPSALRGSFTASLPIDYNGRPWIVTLSAPKVSLYTRFDEYSPLIALAAGFVGSMLVYALFHTLTSSRRHAIRMANDMTGELRESQAKLQVSHERLRQLIAHADQIKEGERKRIAREIHDDLGQNLLALRIEADMLTVRTGARHPRLHERARSTLIQIDATIWSVRQIINGLRPNVLDLGLSAAVEWQIAEFIRRTGIECHLAGGGQEINVDDNCATAFFRILQESLANVVRHSKASSVRVELTLHDAILAMTINDNGVGLVLDGKNKPGSFGLVGIEERISILGGFFSITSLPGHGTTVFVAVPVLSELSDMEATQRAALPSTKETALALV